MTTDMESNSKKYVSCQIHRFTIYPHFGSVAGKQIIKYFVHLMIIWVVNLVESFLSDKGIELMYQKIQIGMLLLVPVIIFLNVSISIILIWLVRKKVSSFETCAKTFVVIK